MAKNIGIFVVHSFDSSDWDAFSGAENFSCGNEPITAEAVFTDGTEFLAILDKSGCEICAGEELVLRCEWGHDFSLANAEQYLKMLGLGGISIERFRSLGYEYLV